MSAPLSSEESKRYTAIVDAILATADLETVSRKKIRQGLEKALGGQDLGAQKNAIKKLIEARFDAVSAADGDGEAETAPPSSPEPVHKKRPATNGNSHSNHYNDSDPSGSASPEPAKKKTKRSASVEDGDARLAAQLQAQENSLARGRSTRGGNDRRAGTKKKAKAPKKKSAKKVGAEDDSDVQGSDGEKVKRKPGGGFQKPFLLSGALSQVCGETQLSRPQVVKRLWEHIKANELQDPSDKRQILCDEKMQAVFKQTKVDMFKMNKEIGNHLYPVEEEG